MPSVLRFILERCAHHLTEGFAKTDLEVQDPELAARRLLSVCNDLTCDQSGGFFDHHGKAVPW